MKNKKRCHEDDKPGPKATPAVRVIVVWAQHCCLVWADRDDSFYGKIFVI